MKNIYILSFSLIVLFSCGKQQEAEKVDSTSNEPAAGQVMVPMEVASVDSGACDWTWVDGQEICIPGGNTCKRTILFGSKGDTVGVSFEKCAK